MLLLLAFSVASPGQVEPHLSINFSIQQNVWGESPPTYEEALNGVQVDLDNGVLNLVSYFGTHTNSLSVCFGV